MSIESIDEKAEEHPCFPFDFWWTFHHHWDVCRITYSWLRNKYPQFLFFFFLVLQRSKSHFSSVLDLNWRFQHLQLKEFLLCFVELNPKYAYVYLSLNNIINNWKTNMTRFKWFWHIHFGRFCSPKMRV